MTEKKVRPLMRAVIKEEYVVITGDMMEAVILNQMIYWSERVGDFDKFIAEEQARQSQEAPIENTMPLLHGWIHKSSLELKEEIMSMDSAKTISRKLDNLVAKGFLDRRNNPQALYDRKYQYRVNFTVIIEALAQEGYTLEGYKVEIPSIFVKKDKEPSKEQPELSDGQSGDSIGQNDKWKGHADESNGHSDSSKGHSVSTIPETTSEIISEINLSSSKVPDHSGKSHGVRMEDQTNEQTDVFNAIGLENLRHQEMVEPIKAILSALLRTGKVGRNKFQKSDTKKQLGHLNADDIDAVIDRFAEQAKKSRIADPVEYIKSSLLKAGHTAEIRSCASSAVAVHDAPSYDIDEFVRLSMQRLNNNFGN
jgi:hypothetical protein